MASWRLITPALFVLAIASMTGGTFIQRRHSIHLSVNTPDDSNFKLDNMERIANEMIASRRERRPSLLASENPYHNKPTCDHHAVFRTIDGTCNNLLHPWMGAAKTPLVRMSPHRYQDGYNEPRIMYHHTNSILPTPRRVSLSVHLTTSNISNDHSHLLMNWGQFIDHDITLSPESGGEGGEEANKTQCCMASPDTFKDKLRECFPISTTHDPTFRRHCIPFLRSAPIPGLPDQPIMRYQMNDLTSFIDGSMVYASTKLKAKVLRSFEGGKLRSKVSRNEEGLPDETDNPRDCFRGNQECRYASGDVRNSEQAALTSIHTLMLRAHNNMATRLEKLNPHWDDERIYQTARKIMGAMMQRITYKEFLPVVLGPKYMKQFDLTLRENGRRFHRYSPNEDCSVMTEFSTVAFRFGHSLIRQTFSHSGSGRTLDLKDVFDAYRTTERHGADGMLKGVIADTIESCDRFMTKGVRDDLFGEEMDLMSFNIQRGRDHAVGSYHDIRRAFRMHIHRDWDSMAGDSHSHTTVNDMKKVYPHPEDVEAFPGGMAEAPTPGGVVGDTFAHIIGSQFKKLRYGDRFWHETTNTRIGFTNGQLAEIRKVTLAMLFCENVPHVRARRWLIKAESRSNPAVHCSTIPKMDLSQWRDAPAHQPAPQTQYTPQASYRSPINRPAPRVPRYRPYSYVYSTRRPYRYRPRPTYNPPAYNNVNIPTYYSNAY